MVEFIKKEVWCVEEAEASRAFLLKFFLDGHRDDLVVVQDNGVFRKCLTYESLLYNVPGSDKVVTVGERIFSDAEEFFADNENRVKLLPVVNDRGELLSCMRWNNQKKERQEPDQKQEEIENAPRLFIKECNEFVYQWLQKFLKEHSEKEIILEGEGWEVLTVSQVMSENGNRIFLNTEGDMDALELTFEGISRKRVNTIKSMWKLKEQYHGCRIFVWLENKEGVDVCTRLMFSGIRIEGFCNNQQEVLETFLSKPVVKLESIVEDSDVLIIYWNWEKIAKLREKYPEMKALCKPYHDVFELRNRIKEKKNVILYDSEKEAKGVAKLLEKRHVQVWAYCAIQGVGKNALWGENIISIEELLEGTDYYNIVLASATVYYEKSLRVLPNRDLDIFVPGNNIFYTAELYMMLGNIGWYLDKAFRENKKMILYGADSCFTNAWLYFFYHLDRKVEKVLDDSAETKEGIGDIYDLAYEEVTDSFVIINKGIEQFVKACELVEDLGFPAFNDNYAGLYAASYRHLEEKKDVTLGHVTATLLENTKYLGFSVYGGENQTDFRIVILGGSTTTSEAYRVPCWPQLLYEKFRQAGRAVTIYNGAVDGYTSCGELYKLIRDVRKLNPDLVISFSGINNIIEEEYPYTFGHLNHIFDEIYGQDYSKGLREESMSAAQIWVQQEQMMEAISRSVYGAEFICFVQPMYVSKERLFPEERLKFEQDELYRIRALEFRRDVSEIVERFVWMTDLQDILDEKAQVFLDSMHVNEEGNRIIADAVYQQISGKI